MTPTAALLLSLAITLAILFLAGWVVAALALLAQIVIFIATAQAALAEN